ncbi:MAG: hypothetical protein EOM25_15140, partial [Deltaproteobacteria bacterium]|nr:hypothetical protein [Deltaproteobacteria bacterium]
METNKTLQLLESHPLTVKMREEQAAEILAVRQAAFESMVLSKDEAGRQAEKIQQKIDKAMEALEAKKAALASAKSAVLTLQA